MIDTFIKNFISCKIRPSPNIIVACYPLLSQINQELFSKTVVPALQKAMLRNPEVILECVGLVISGVDLDLSTTMGEIGNSLIGKDKIIKLMKNYVHFFFSKFTFQR